VTMIANTATVGVPRSRDQTVMTRHLEIDGRRVGPEFSGDSDWRASDDEIAHRWMAQHHPGCGYSIVSTRLGRCCRRANYAASAPPRRLQSAVS
jgi:hypothetical protein